jgi:hypothetical protein
MLDLVSQVQCPLHKRYRGDEADRPVAQRGERGVAVIAGEFAKPDFLPEGVAEFEQQEVLAV